MTAAGSGLGLGRFPRHVLLTALIAGLLLARRPDIAIGVGAVLAAALLADARGPAPAVCATAVAATLGGALVGQARLQAIDRAPLAQLDGRVVAVRGHVIRRERPSFGVRRLRLRVERVRAGSDVDEVSEVVQLRVRPRVSLPSLSVGDELEVQGALAKPRDASGGRSGYPAYLRRAGVHLVMTADDVRRTGRRRGGLNGAIDAVRRRAERGVGAGLGTPLAALARGMALGQDEDVPAATSEDFKRAGLAHLLAVSGQNVTLLALLAWPLLAGLGLGRRARLAGVLALIALYVPLTGASPSILRAGLMGGAGTVAALAGRPASRWYFLLLATAGTLALDPRAWQDVGWQLSFAAVVGIFALCREITEALRWLPEPVAAGIAVTVAATLATGPLMAFHFDRLSLVTLPANVLALPAIAPAMWMAMLSAAISQVSLLPAELLNALNAYMLAYIAAVAGWSARVPGAALEVGIGSLATLVAAYLVIAAIVIAVRTRASGHRRIHAAAVAALALASLVLAASHLGSGGLPAPPTRFTLTFLDVGQGDATLIQSPEGVAMLVDGGPPGAGLVGKLRAHGVGRLDLVVLTHAQLDHEGGLEDLLRELSVRMLLDGAASPSGPLHQRVLAAARSGGARIVRGHAPQRLRLGSLRVQVLSPPDVGVGHRAADEDPNRRALVLLVSHGSFDVFLPADAESEVTAALPLRPVEVLKVAHHGSADEGLTALLERLRPRVAVVEVGAGNPYGHPTPATMAKLGRSVPQVFRTDADGDVGIQLQAGGMRVFASGRSMAVTAP